MANASLRSRPLDADADAQPAADTASGKSTTDKTADAKCNKAGKCDEFCGKNGRCCMLIDANDKSIIPDKDCKQSYPKLQPGMHTCVDARTAKQRTLSGSSFELDYRIDKERDLSVDVISPKNDEIIITVRPGTAEEAPMPVVPPQDSGPAFAQLQSSSGGAPAGTT